MKEYPVDHLRLFRNASKYTLLSFAIIIPIGAGIQAASSEKARSFILDWLTDPAKLLSMAGVICSILIGLLAFLFVITWFSQLWAVRLEGNRIAGRNYYGFKRSFNLEDVDAVDFLSNNGISGWILKTQGRGSIYILSTTKEVESLLERVDQELAKKAP